MITAVVASFIIFAMDPLAIANKRHHSTDHYENSIKNHID